MAADTLDDPAATSVPPAGDPPVSSTPSPDETAANTGPQDGAPEGAVDSSPVPLDPTQASIDDPDAALPEDSDAPGASDPTEPPPAPEQDAPVPAVEPAANDPPAEERGAAVDFTTFAAGAAEPPVPVWTETFETGTTNTPSRVDQYASSRYTGSAFWVNVSNCNGVVVNYNATFPATPFCTLGDSVASRFKVARMADVLGQVQANAAAGAVNPGGATDTTPVNGSTATTRGNHAVTAMTSAAQGTQAANQTVLESVGALGPAPATGGDRYYAVSIDVAEDSCAARPGGQNNNSRLDLALVVGTTARPLTASPIIACNVVNGRYTSNVFPADNQTDPWGTGSPSTRAGRFTTDTAVLLTPAQVASARLRLSNQISQTSGNDFSFDNLALLDATPSLDMQFGPAVVPAGTPSTLTFTVTNTSEAAAKPDWGFTHRLPAGLVVAPSTTSPAIGGTCVNVTGSAFVVTAAEGASTITAAGGDLAAGAISCTVTVAVVSATGGSYTTGPGDVTTILNAPEAASLTVEQPTTVTIRKNVVSRALAADQFRLSLFSGTTEVATATTSGTGLGLQSQQVGPVSVTRGATYTVAESIVTTAQLRSYTSTYECTRGTTVIARGTSVSGSLTIPDEAGVSIVCTFTNTAQATPTLYCDGSYFYSVRSDGALTQTNALSSASSVTPAVVAAGPTGAANANSLAIDVEGRTAYAITRSTSTNTNTATGVITYSVSASGTLTATRTAFATAQTLGASASIVMGAFDPVSRSFIVGTTSLVNTTGRITLWRFNGATANPVFTQLGYVNTGTNSAGNGDMAFDAKGNLHILRSEGTQAQFFTVAGPTLAATPAGGEMAATATTQRTVAGIGAGPLNGLAFSSRGTAYVGTGTNAYQFDPSTWTAIPNTPTIVLGTDATPSTDLATCASPSTFSLSKVVLSRVTGQAHNFRIAVATGGSETASATTGTTGTTASIGPLPTPVNTAVSISELLQGTSTTSPVPATYTVIYECWADGVRLVSGRMDATRTATVTIPNQVSVGVACTIYNTAQPVAQITVRKSLVDGLGANPQPAAGWTVGAAVASAGAGTVVLPTDPNTAGAAAGRSEVTTDATGAASFYVLYSSSTGSATVSVLERQQTGYRLDGLTCTVTRGTATTSFTDANAAVDASGYAVRGVTGTIAPGNAVDCTFTNRPVATLTLIKQVSFGSAAPSAWQLQAVRSSASALAGPSGAGGSGTLNSVPVSAGTAYRLSETGGPATYVQVGAWSCLTSTGATIPVSAAGDITLTRGTTATCTVTNATASLTLLKNVQNPSTGFQPSTWNLTATPATLTGLTARTVAGADVQAGGNPANTFDVRPGHIYTLSEALAQSGTRLAYRQVRLELLLPNGTWTPMSSTTITAPAAGQSAVYRFVNAPVVPTALPLTGGPSADAYAIAGSAALALALALAVWHGRRRTRRRTV